MSISSVSLVSVSVSESSIPESGSGSLVSSITVFAVSTVPVSSIICGPSVVDFDDEEVHPAREKRKMVIDLNMRIGGESNQFVQTMYN